MAASARIDFIARVAIAAAIFLVPSSALAWEFRLVPTTPISSVVLGDVVIFDAFMDTQGESKVWALSVGVGYDPTGFMYREDLSASGMYVLYAPGRSKADPPPYATWLEGVQQAPILLPPETGIDAAALNLISNHQAVPPGTIATATDDYIGTFAFEAIAEGTSTFEIGFVLPFGHGVFVWNETGDDRVYITEGVAFSNPIDVDVPEPSRLLLFVSGAMMLCVFARRRVARNP